MSDNSKDVQKKIIFTLLNKTGKSLSEIGPQLKSILQKAGKVSLVELQPLLEANDWDLAKAEAAALAQGETPAAQPTDIRSAWEQASRESKSSNQPQPQPQLQPQLVRQPSSSSLASVPDLPPPPVMHHPDVPTAAPMDFAKAVPHTAPSEDTASLASLPQARPEPLPATPQETGTPNDSGVPVAPPSFMDNSRGSYPAPSFKRLGSLVGSTPLGPLSEQRPRVDELQRQQEQEPPAKVVPSVPVVPMTTLKAEIEEKQKENVIKKAAMESKLHRERMEELERELELMKQLKDERAKQTEDKSKEDSHINHKVAAATMEWKHAFSSISPHLTQMGDKEFTPESVSRSWKKATDATAALEVHKDMLQAEKQDRDDERKVWAKRLDELSERRAKDLKEQETVFAKLLEQKGQEQTALVHVFHSRLTQVQEAYEAQLELSNAEAERLMGEQLISPPRQRPEAPALAAVTPVAQTQLRKGARGPVLSPATATTTAGILEGLDIGSGDVMGYSDSEVERQAEAAARHIAKLGKGGTSSESGSSKKLRKTRKKEATTPSSSTPSQAPLSVEVLRKQVQAMTESPAATRNKAPLTASTTSALVCHYCRHPAQRQSNYCNSCGAYLKADQLSVPGHITSPTRHPTYPTAQAQPSPVPTSAQSSYSPYHNQYGDTPSTGHVHEQGWSKRHVEKKLWDARRHEHRQFGGDSYVQLEAPSVSWKQTTFTQVGRGRESPSKMRPRISDVASPQTSYFPSA